MERLLDLVRNPFLAAGISSWLIAQILKAIIHAIINRKFDFRRLFGDGGMPSGHSATVSSLAVLSALVYGMDSFYFAISAVLAIIVSHDAMGVRRETGKQAVVINELVQALAVSTSKKSPVVKLKEYVGHTPVQVFVGIIVGTVDAFAIYNSMVL